MIAGILIGIAIGAVLVSIGFTIVLYKLFDGIWS